MDEPARHPRLAAERDLDGDDGLRDADVRLHAHRLLAGGAARFHDGEHLGRRQAALADEDLGADALSRQRLVGVEQDDDREVERPAERRRQAARTEAEGCRAERTAPRQAATSVPRSKGRQRRLGIGSL
jgi:hypothetical protein